MALNATVGGATANSYLSQSAASAYFADRLDAAVWTGATGQYMDAALIRATQRLEQERYSGCKASSTQKLAWPRTGTYDREGHCLSSVTIPVCVQEAACELALALLREPGMLDDSGLSQFSSVQIDTLAVTLNAGASIALPMFVKQLISPVRLGGMMTYVSRA